MKYDDKDMYVINFSKINTITTMKSDVDNVELSRCTYSTMLQYFLQYLFYIHKRVFVILISVYYFCLEFFFYLIFIFILKLSALKGKNCAKRNKIVETLKLWICKNVSLYLFRLYSLYDLLIYSQKRISKFFLKII